MPGKKLRVILDTNLWISFLITKDLTKLDALLEQHKIKLIFSQELLDEFIAVAKRPKFKKFIKPHDLEALLLMLEPYAEIVPVNTVANACRDVKDNFLLALAADAKANYLLTGDKDLLTLKKYKTTKIITLTEFLNS